MSRRENSQHRVGCGRCGQGIVAILLVISSVLGWASPGQHHGADLGHRDAHDASPTQPGPAVAMGQPDPRHPPGSIVASGHALATDAGIQILRQGGNAFDAAVAVSAALAVVEPISSGLGGGGFFLLHQASTGQDIMLDAREFAPRADTSARYMDDQGKHDPNRSVNGPWSMAIPGLPAALVALASQYGQLPLTQSLQPAIALARSGFPVYSRLVDGYQLRRQEMARYPSTRAIFAPRGQPLRDGQILRQPELAQTLAQLGRQGWSGFYRGTTARRLLAAVRHAGGRWTAPDLASYQVKWRKPIVFRYHDWTVVTAPPPSSGGIALAQMLQMVEGWDLNHLDPVKRTHLLVEAMRRAFHDRAFYLGDPDFVSIPMDLLTSKPYALGLRATIHPDRALPSQALSGQPPPLEDLQTTHFSIIDHQGNRVAATQTLNLQYGSGMVAKGTGVLLNDEMDDFALTPGVPNSFGVMGFAANAPQPGKRMLSSMTPTFLQSPHQVVVLGTPGGSRIITIMLLAILGVDAGLDPGQVASLPRFHHQWLPDVIDAEQQTFTPQQIQLLQAMGHTVHSVGDTSVSGRGSSHAWGNLQIVRWQMDQQRLSGASDPRSPEGGVAQWPSSPVPPAQSTATTGAD